MAENVRLGGVYVTFRGVNSQFLRATNQNIDAVRRQRRAFNSLRGDVRRIQRSVAGFARTVGTVFSGALFAGATAAISQFGRQSAEFGATLRENSNRIGLTIEELQLLGRVFEGNGASQQDFIKGLRSFNRNLVEAQLGVESYRRQFRLAGIDVDELRRQGVSGADAFLLLADGLRSISDQTVRVAVAQSLLGRSGFALLATLQEGGEAIQTQAESFRSLGVVTAEQADRLKVLEQSYTDTGNSIKTAVAGITADNAALFVSFNRFLQTGVPRAFNTIVQSLEFLRQNLFLVRGAAILLGVALLRRTFVFRFARGIGAVLLTIRSLPAAFAAAAVAARAFGVALVRTGIGAAIVLFGELVALLYEARQAGLSLGDTFNQLGDVIREAAARWRDAIDYLLTSYDIFTARVNIGGGMIIRSFERVANFVGNTFTGVFAGVAAAIVQSFQNMVARVRFLFDNMLHGIRVVGVNIVNSIIQTVNDASSALSAIPGIDFAEIPLLNVPQFRGEIGAVGEEAGQSLADAFGRGFDRGSGVFDAQGGLGQSIIEGNRRVIDDLKARQATIGESLFAPLRTWERFRAAIRRAGPDIDAAVDGLGDLPDFFSGATGAVTDLDAAINNVGETTRRVGEQTMSVSQRLALDLQTAYRTGIDGATRFGVAAITGFESASDAARQFARTLVTDVLSAFVRSGIHQFLASFLGVPLPSFQQGGLAQRGLALVGESGPEIVDFRSPGRVYSNDELAGAIGGGGMTFNFAPVIQSADSAAVSRAIAEAYPAFEQNIRASIAGDARRPSSLRRQLRG